MTSGKRAFDESKLAEALAVADEFEGVVQAKANFASEVLLKHDEGDAKADIAIDALDPAETIFPLAADVPVEHRRNFSVLVTRLRVGY